MGALIAVLALALSATLLAGWLLLGYALLDLLRPLGPPVRRALLAPAAGVAVLVLALYWLSVSGLPVGVFGRPLTVSLLVAAGSSLAWRRPGFPGRAWRPFAAALLGSLGLVGWPMLVSGFGWLGSLNDDMANYSLLAARVLRHGLLEIPDPALLAEGRDHSLHYWWQDIFGARPGNHLLLAWVSSLTGLTVHQVFMPTMLALQLVLVSALSGLVYRSPSWRPAARATAWLAAGSALVALGTVYQLIAQAAGLGLLFALAALCLRRLPGRWCPHRLRAAAAAGVVASALVLVYPEVMPFLVAALALWTVTAGGRRRRRVWWTAAALGIAAGAVLPGAYVSKFARYLLHQVRAGLVMESSPASARHAVTLFSDYLDPKGLAVLWGWQVRGGALGWEPWASLTIVAGGVLLAFAAYVAARQALRGHPPASLAIGMLALAGALFVGRAAFGLFKLGMYVQPLLLASLATAAERPSRHRTWRRIALLLLAVSGLSAQTAYVRSSHGSPGQDLSEGFRRLLARVPGDRVDLDTVEPFLIKMQALHLVGRSAVYRGRDVFTRLRGSFDPEAIRQFGVASPGLAQVAAVREALAARTRRVAFPMLDPARPELVATAYLRDRYPAGTGRADECDVLVLSARRVSVLNGRRPSDAPDGSPAVQPCATVRNHLIFVWSDLGQHYYLARESRRIGLFRIQSDPLFPGGRFAAVGRYLLLEAFHPDETVRLSLALSVSPLGGPDRPLPPAAVVGETRVRFPLVGQGSARVLSPPLRPLAIAGRRYVALDLGADPRPLSVRRPGWLRLYGSDIHTDSRWAVGFARDISLVAEREHASLRSPRAVVRFPTDLADSALEYSGISERGWVADAAFLVLGGEPETARLRIRGHVPEIGDPAFRTDLEVRADGRVWWRGAVGVGPFEVAAPVRAADRIRIELRFSRLQTLPMPDGRRVAARLGEVALEAGAAALGPPPVRDLAGLGRPADRRRVPGRSVGFPR